MEFHFDVKVTPFDFFKMAIKKTYKSPIGVCNIVFTVAVILLTVKLYPTAVDVLRLALIILCLIFPVFQPLSIYFRGKAQVMNIPKGLSLDVDDSQIVVSVERQREVIVWSRVKEIIDNKDMVILRVDSNNGYFLTNKVLDDKRDAFINFVKSKIGNR